MTLLYFISGIITLGVFIYLVAALIKGETWL
ncbi:MAG: potassium-transporting ATPase subunit F [Candidatus Omnitrophica bacterium]|nr:potassium-transporting ATPase subunit F [Candidatus Omnitrophota bacterium]